MDAVMIVNIVNTVVILVGFTVVFFIQRAQIKAMKHNSKSMKELIEIFQPDKIKEYVSFREQTFEDKMNLEVNKMKREMEEQSKKFTSGLKPFVDQYVDTVKVVYAFAYYVDRDNRRTIFEKYRTTGLDKMIIDEVPYYGDVRAGAIAKVLSEFKSGKSILGGVRDSEGEKEDKG